MTKSKISTYIYLALAMIIFGSSAPASKVVTQAFPVFVASTIRITLGILVLLPFIIDNKPIKRLNRKDFYLLFSIALFGVVLFNLTILYGLKLIPATIGGIVMSTSPAVTATGAIIFLKEKLTKNKFIAISLAVLGLLILNIGSSTESNHFNLLTFFGIILIFSNVCCESAYTLLGKRLLKKLSPIYIVFYSNLISLFLFLPLFFIEIREFNLSIVTLNAWLALLWWGAFIIGLGAVIWYKGVQKTDASIAAGFMGLIPISALLISYFILNEPLHWSHLAGLTLEIAAIYFITRKENYTIG